MTPIGYLHPGYAASLSEFGEPTPLPRSGAWFLKRPIPGTPDFDGMGCYPYLACQDWTALAADLDELRGKLVSFAAAPEPFGRYTLDDLHRAFPDSVIRFKDHFVADLLQPPETFISRHHRRDALKALRQLEVEFCPEPLRYLDEWNALFQSAIEKFNITGIRAFSRQAFAQQFAIPGSVMSLARHQGRPVAAHVQFTQQDAAYGHLAAAEPSSYKLGAAYALYFAEIHYYAGKVRWLDWAGEAGVEQRDDKLSSFKRGWSTGTHQAYFCGRILAPDRYQQLTRKKNVGPTRYFPAYRQGEFG